jgi:arabinan endo-1,5-alpha-L-arabinosidase
MQYDHGWYYFYVNWGMCCRGVDSTYNIRVGRSRTITGPFLDRNGTDMADGGRSIKGPMLEWLASTCVTSSQTHSTRVIYPPTSSVGGTLLMGTESFRIGPGQTGITTSGTGFPTFTFHFYDARDNGAPTLGMAALSYSSDGWPQLSNVCG